MNKTDVIKIYYYLIRFQIKLNKELIIQYFQDKKCVLFETRIVQLLILYLVYS